MASAVAAAAALQPRCSSLAPVSSRSSRAVPFAGRQQQRRVGRQAGCLRVQALLTAEKSELDVSKMAPLGDRLLVRPQEVEKQTAGGILLTTSGSKSMQDALVGTVMAVGEGVDVGVAVGDRVLFSKYSSSDVEVPDGEVCFVAQKSILAKLS